jgi:hypothetical protein
VDRFIFGLAAAMSLSHSASVRKLGTSSSLGVLLRTRALTVLCRKVSCQVGFRI